MRRVDGFMPRIVIPLLVAGLGCQAHPDWPEHYETPKLAPIEANGIELEWDLGGDITPPTWNEIGETSLHPVRERDDSGIPERFGGVLDLVDQAGISDVSSLTWYEWEAGGPPQRFGAIPAHGFWAPRWKPELWVVDELGNRAPTTPLRERVPEALVVHPEVFEWWDEARAGNASRGDFREFVARRAPGSEGVQAFRRDDWLVWARWAQMQGDNETASKWLVEYEEEVHQLCRRRCGKVGAGSARSMRRSTWSATSFTSRGPTSRITSRVRFRTNCESIGLAGRTQRSG